VSYFPYPGSGVLALVSWLSCPGAHFLGPIFRVPYPGLYVLACVSWLVYPGAHTRPPSPRVLCPGPVSKRAISSLTCVSCSKSRLRASAHRCNFYSSVLQRRTSRRKLSINSVWSGLNRSCLSSILWLSRNDMVRLRNPLLQELGWIDG
jgi:hypothetical protein